LTELDVIDQWSGDFEACHPRLKEDVYDDGVSVEGEAMEGKDRAEWILEGDGI
jgi:hypothetical protein